MRYLTYLGRFGWTEKSKNNYKYKIQRMEVGVCGFISLLTYSSDDKSTRFYLICVRNRGIGVEGSTLTPQIVLAIRLKKKPYRLRKERFSSYIRVLRCPRKNGNADGYIEGSISPFSDRRIEN